MKDHRRYPFTAIIRTVLLCLILTAGGLRAQTGSSDLDFARKLYDDGLYLLAANQYQEFAREYPDSPLAAQASLMAAESFFAQGDLSAAEQGYRDFLRRYPQDASISQAWFRLGQCLQRMDRHEEAVAAYGRSRQVDPQGEWAPRSLLSMALALRDQGQPRPALEELDTFIVQYPQDPHISSAYLARGEILQIQGHLDEAAEAFQSAARTAGAAAQRSRAGYRRGRILIRQGDETGAIDLLDTVARADSASIHADSALLVLGDLYAGDGQYGLAARAYGQLSARTGDRALAEQGGLEQARTLQLSGDPAAAMEAYRRWLDDHPDSPLRAQARLGMADIYEGTGQPNSAALVLEDLARQGGDEAWGREAWLRLADLQRRMGQGERALTAYRGFLSRYPQAARADSITFLMARIQEEDLGRTQAALATYRELLGSESSGRWAERAAFAVGRLQETAGDYEQALESYRHFARQYPHSPMVPRARERIAYLSDYRIPEEPLALEAMVDIQDQLASGILTQEQVDLRLADIYLRHLRNFDRAAAALQRFLDRHAGSGLTDEALYQLSRCHAMKAEMLRIDGDLAGAAQERQTAVRACRRLLRDHPDSRRADACAFTVIADIVRETESDSLPAWSEHRELYESFLRTYPASQRRPLALLRVGEILWKSDDDSLTLVRADSIFALVTAEHGSSAWADSAAWYRVTLAHQLGDKQTALAAGQDFLWNFPESPLRSRVFNLLAEIHEGNGDHLQAARLYRSVAEDFPYHDLTEQAWLSQARSFAASGDPAQAQRVLERFTQRYPHSELRHHAALLMARYAAAQGQIDRARALLAGIEDDGSSGEQDPAVGLALGDVYRQLGDLEAALTRYRDVREAHGGRPEAQEAVERMATAAFEAGDYARAGEYYQQALAGEPGTDALIDLSAGRIRCLYRQGLVKEAVRAREEFARTYRQETEGVAGLLLEEAQAYLENGEDKQAGRALETILEGYPGTLGAQEAEYRLGVMALSAGRYQEALERFTALLDRYPDTDLEGQVLFKMGSALYALERYPDASLQYRRAAERISDDDLRADALFNAGICRARMNDWDGAISAYRELLEGFPGHPESGTWSLRLGFAYLEAGQAGRALETFVGIDPGADDELGAELQFWIGECYFKMDRYERAAEEYLRVGFLYPHQVQWAATAEYNAGVSYEKMGRAEEARTIYRKLIRTRGTGDQWGRMAEERLRQLGE